MGQARRTKLITLSTPEERRMRCMGIDPNHPEYAIAPRILSNMQLKAFLRNVEPANQQIAYDKLKPLLQFEVQPFDILIAADA